MSTLDQLTNQKQLISTQYAECCLALRAHEVRERELASALRLMHDQIKIEGERLEAEKSGNSKKQAVDSDDD